MTKRRFTWLDAVICLVVLAVAAVAVWYFTRDNNTASAAEYEVTLRFERATEDPYDYYKVGDVMYFQERAAELGTITALAAVEYPDEEYDAVNGRYVKVLPKLGGVEMKLRVQGAVIGGEFTVNGETIHIGEVFYPQTDTTRSIMTVWNIEEVTA